MIAREGCPAEAAWRQGRTPPEAFRYTDRREPAIHRHRRLSSRRSSGLRRLRRSQAVATDDPDDPDDADAPHITSAAKSTWPRPLHLRAGHARRGR